MRYRLFSLYLVFFFLAQPVLCVRQVWARNAQNIGNEVLTLRSFKDKEAKGDALKTTPDILGIPSSGPGASSSVYFSIHVLGEVQRPGIYKILPSDRVNEALNYAGGVLPTGTQRFIQLKRDGRVTNQDMFAYFTKGDLNQNSYLMENDVIYVPIKKGEIQIVGSVYRPGYYEIWSKIRLSDALKMAGGFAVGHSREEPINVIRYDDKGKKEIISVENSEASFKKFKLVKGDIAVVPHVLNKDKKFDYSINRIPGDNIFYPTADPNVYVIGAVSQPGPYAYEPSYSVRQYINMAGPTKDAKFRSLKRILPNGKRDRVSKDEHVNPGDTIFIPERHWKPEVILGVATSILGITVTVISLRNF